MIEFIKLHLNSNMIILKSEVTLELEKLKQHLNSNMIILKSKNGCRHEKATLAFKFQYDNT